MSEIVNFPSKGSKPPKPEITPEQVEQAAGVQTVDLASIGIDLTPKGGIRQTLENRFKLLAWLYPKTKLRFNRISGKIEINGRPFRETDPIQLCRELENWGLKCGVQQVREIVAAIAESPERRYNPIGDYLLACNAAWDRVERNDTMLHRYFGVADTPLSREVSRLWLRSCVARAFEPGCDVHTMLILKGRQGAGKSRGLRALCPRSEWFGDTHLDLSSKDVYEKIAGKWIYEIAELEAFGKSNWNSIKSLITSSKDNYRAAYAREAEARPRLTIFTGTTNQSEFLGDTTGSRRFWPFEVGRVWVDELVRDRDQIWGEAVEGYRAGLQWHLGQNLEAELEAHQDEFKTVDPWTEPIAAWVKRNGNAPITVADVAIGALTLKIDQVDPHRVKTRVGAILTELLENRGWEYKRLNTPGRPRAWVKKEGA